MPVNPSLFSFVLRPFTFVMSALYRLYSAFVPSTTTSTSPVRSIEDATNKPKHVLSSDLVGYMTKGSLGAHNGFGFRSLNAASQVLRAVAAVDSRFQNNNHVDIFFNMLTRVQELGLSQSSFEFKNVIVMEGLGASGKSCAAARVQRFCRSAAVIDYLSNPIVRNVLDVFAAPDVPPEVAKAFRFVLNYFVAYSIVTSPHEIFIIEQYFHSVCVRNIVQQIHFSQEEIEKLPASAVEWPYDLPIPQLVVFMSVETTNRLHRQAAVTTSKPTAAAAAGGGRNNSIVTDAAIDQAAGEDNVAKEDYLSNLIYSMVSGSTTLGIDANGSMSEVSQTIIAALQSYSSIPLECFSTDEAEEYEAEHNQLHVEQQQQQHHQEEQQQDIESHGWGQQKNSGSAAGIASSGISSLANSGMTLGSDDGGSASWDLGESIIGSHESGSAGATGINRKRSSGVGEEDRSRRRRSNNRHPLGNSSSSSSSSTVSKSSRRSSSHFHHNKRVSMGVFGAFCKPTDGEEEDYSDDDDEGRDTTNKSHFTSV